MSDHIRVFVSRGIYRRKGDVGGQVGPLAIARHGPTLGRALLWRGALGAPPDALRTPEASRSFIYGGKDFVRFREYIFRVGFLKSKTAENTELALWHLVNRLVPENA